MIGRTRHRDTRTKIGKLATRIVEVLAREGTLTIRDIFDRIRDASVNDVMLGLGWLLQEDRIAFLAGTRPTRVALRNEAEALDECDR